MNTKQKKISEKIFVALLDKVAGKPPVGFGIDAAGNPVFSCDGRYSNTSIEIEQDGTVFFEAMGYNANYSAKYIGMHEKDSRQMIEEITTKLMQA